MGCAQRKREEGHGGATPTDSTSSQENTGRVLPSQGPRERGQLPPRKGSLRPFPSARKPKSLHAWACARARSGMLASTPRHFQRGSREMTGGSPT